MLILIMTVLLIGKKFKQVWMRIMREQEAAIADLTTNVTPSVTVLIQTWSI